MLSHLAKNYFSSVGGSETLPAVPTFPAAGPMVGSN